MKRMYSMPRYAIIPLSLHLNYSPPPPPSYPHLTPLCSRVIQVLSPPGSMLCITPRVWSTQHIPLVLQPASILDNAPSAFLAFIVL